MQPLKPTDAESILRAAPAAAPADLEEYERLLSARYRKDPSQVNLTEATDPDEARLKELEKKLFGSANNSSSANS